MLTPLLDNIREVNFLSIILLRAFTVNDLSTRLSEPACENRDETPYMQSLAFISLKCISHEKLVIASKNFP